MSILTIFDFITNGKSLKLFYKNWLRKHGNQNYATYNLKIGPQGSMLTYEIFPKKSKIKILLDPRGLFCTYDIVSQAVPKMFYA